MLKYTVKPRVLTDRRKTCLKGNRVLNIYYTSLPVQKISKGQVANYVTLRVSRECVNKILLRIILYYFKYINYAFWDRVS